MFLTNLLNCFIFFAFFHQLTIISTSKIKIEIAINCDNKTLSLIPFVTNAILNWNSSTLEVQTIIKLNSDQFDTNDKYFQSNLIKSKMELLPFMMIDLTEKTTESNAPEFHVRRLARELLLPTIALGRQISRLDRFPAEWQQLTAVEQQFLIQLHPPIDLMSQVVPHLLHHFRPKAVTLLYEKAFHLEARVGHLFKKFKGRHVLRQIDGKQPNHLRKVMEDMIKIRNGHFYVLASIDTLNQILRLANEFELFNIDREWYLISRQNGQLRCDTCHRGSVVFGQPLPIQRLLYDHEPQLPTTSDIGNITMVSRLSGLFVYDSTRFLLTGLDELLRSSPQSVLPDANGVLRWPAPSAINFPSTRNWFRLRTILLQESFFGYFGRFVMQRSVPQFGYQEMTLKLIRYELWRRKPIVNVEPMAKRDPPADTMKSNTESGVIIAANSQLQSFVALRLAEWVFQWPDGYLVWTAALEQSRPKRHFRIVTIVQAPFVMKHGNNTNPEWYGYCIDLLHEMQREMNQSWSFELYEVPDGEYGVKDRKTQKWNGVIGELANDKADIAVGAVAVMAERESVVDFTVPYYDLVGVSILMKKSASRSHLFKFLTVLDNQVWACIAGAYIVTSICLWALDKFSPFSYSNNRLLYERAVEKRDFTIKECFWFCMTSITPQGGGESPRNYSGKMAVATWWSFGFIIIACYTANLAAFLTVSRLDSPIESLTHLIEQYRIKYAPQVGTQALTYFERMAYIEKRFYEIWKQMNVEGIGVSERERARLAVWDYPVSDRYTKILHQMHLTGLPLTFEEGIRRVKKSKSAQEGFAFLADATKVKYAAMIDCDLRQVGNEFSRKPLALAVRENSTLKDELSSAILKLLNQRKLEELKEKWWTENKERRGDCDYDRKSNDGISINNIGGVFVVIFVGVGLASVTLLGEWLWRRYHAPNIRTTAIVRIKDRHLQPGYSGPQQQTPSHPSSNACAHLPPFATQYGGIGSSMHMPAFSSALAGMYERPRTMLPIS